jgi:hypothetical protein
LTTIPAPRGTLSTSSDAGDPAHREWMTRWLLSPGCGRLRRRPRDACKGRRAGAQLDTPAPRRIAVWGPLADDRSLPVPTKRGTAIATSMQTRTAATPAACLTSSLPLHAEVDRLEGVGCFGRNPSYDIPNNRRGRCAHPPPSAPPRVGQCMDASTIGGGGALPQMQERGRSRSRACARLELVQGESQVAAGSDDRLCAGAKWCPVRGVPQRDGRAQVAHAATC